MSLSSTIHKSVPSSNGKQGWIVEIFSHKAYLIDTMIFHHNIWQNEEVSFGTHFSRIRNENSTNTDNVSLCITEYDRMTRANTVSFI